MNPKASIIVPIYNLEFYLDRCLRSVLEQTFSGSYEVVIVNDGSTDDSPLVIQEFAAAHPKLVRYFTKENGGHGSACNLGIEQARGDYLLFVDGDDYLGSNHIEKMVTKAEETGSDLLIGDMVYHFGNHTEPFQPLPLEFSGRRLDHDGRTALFKNWPTPCGRLYRRTLFEDPDVRMLPGVIHADVSFAPKTYWAAKSIFYTGHVYYHYDMTRSGQTMKMTNARIMNIVPVLTDVLEFFKKKGAFEDYRYELETYTMSHVLSWIPKIAGMEGYPRRQAYHELFQILEDYFPGWVKSAVFDELRPLRTTRFMKSRPVMKFSRALDYRTYLWMAEARKGMRWLHTMSLQAAWKANKVPPKLRRLMDRIFGDLQEPL